MKAVRAKFINRTHRIIELAKGVNLAPYATEILDVLESNKIRQLSRAGLIQILPEGGKHIDRSSISGTPAVEAQQAKRNSILAAMKAAQLKREEITGKISLQSSTKTTKITSGTKSSNAKGK